MQILGIWTILLKIYPNNVAWTRLLFVVFVICLIFYKHKQSKNVRSAGDALVLNLYFPGVTLVYWVGDTIISIGWCTKDVTTLLMHWSYVFLPLTHRHEDIRSIISNKAAPAWHQGTQQYEYHVFRLVTNVPIYNGYKWLPVCIEKHFIPRH